MAEAAALYMSSVQCVGGKSVLFIAHTPMLLSIPSPAVGEREYHH